MYAAIDMKSFYASVECVERNLNPLDTNLVVADTTRTEKTICLAVSPALKEFGVSGRPRLFEVIQTVDIINRQRLNAANIRHFKSKSCHRSELIADNSIMLDYLIAPPQMTLYEDYSARIHSILLRYFSAEDIHVYSCDESFIYIEPYLETYHMSARDLVMTVIRDILKETGITSTAGIGTNMYLCKIAMDIIAKKITADENGVRIAELDELSYREQLWEHTPLTDFWQLAKGINARLQKLGLRNMGDICLQSLINEEVLYKEFGVEAELIIDHAWGWESCTIADIKRCKPKSRSVSSSQVLARPYEFNEAVIILREMVEALVQKIIAEEYLTSGVSLYVSYDSSNVYAAYNGRWSTDAYGRRTPRQLSVSRKIEATSSNTELTEIFLKLFNEQADHQLRIRKIGLSLNNLVPETEIEEKYIQYDIFSDVEALEHARIQREKKLAEEKAVQKALLEIKDKFGKNSILRGSSYLAASTARERNTQIGGHRA